MKILELFGGIGACTQALKRLGINFEITDYVEIDKYAVKSYNAINGTNFKPQDITKWDKDIDVDLIMHGSPCQDFSIAGKQAGGDEDSGTRSSLMYETIRIVESLHPKYVVWENVKNLLSKKHRHNFDAYLEELNQLGYNNYYQVLNAKDYGIPQNRERVYTISIRKDIDNGTFTFPEKEELKLRLKDMLEDEVDEKYYLSDKIVEKITYSNFAQEKARLQEKEYCDTLLARDYKDPKCIEVNRKYGVFDLEEQKHQAGSVYSKEGLAPTLDTMQGGYRQPLVEEEIKIRNFDSFIEKKYNNFIEKNGYIPEMFNPYNESKLKDIAPTQSAQCGSTTSSSTVLKLEEKLPVGNGGGVEKDVINPLKDKTPYGWHFEQNVYSEDSKCCRTVKSGGGSGNIPKVIGGIGEKKSNGGTQWYQQDRIYDNNVGLSVSTTAIPYYPDNQLRIRKLTPKECWRLMGFSDECFEKAEKVNSNTQLYKQAGNSIVVDVLYKIFKNLFNIG